MCRSLESICGASHHLPKTQGLGTGETCRDAGGEGLRTEGMFERVVRNPPCNAGDMGSIPGHMGLIPGWETKIPQATEKLSLRTANCGSPSTLVPVYLNWGPCTTAKIPSPTANSNAAK